MCRGLRTSVQTTPDIDSRDPGPVLPLSVPFAVAARRQFGADWDDHITGLSRRAGAVASLLRALPRRLHRLVPADGTPVKGSPRQRQVLYAACAAWAEQHPDLAELVMQSADNE